MNFDSTPFAKQQELAVLDTALGYLVRDGIISNDLRANYIEKFGAKVIREALKAIPDSTANKEKP